MFKVFQKISSAYQQHYLRVGRARARELLLRQSDRLLADAGFSRELLEKGVDAWPWQVEEPLATVETSVRSAATAQADPSSLSTAMEELSAYTDKELADIGVTRSNIADAVRFGRPGIDVPPSDSHEFDDNRHAA